MSRSCSRRILPRWGASETRIEDLEAETREHPFYDEFWATKAADLARITVRAYIVASWSDQALHTRGTLEGFKQIRSAQKWLEVHGRKKWYYYYEPQSVQRQQAFFDHFLLGKETSLSEWPKVRLEVRERYYVGDVRGEDEWPIARTRYTKLHLNCSTASLQSEPVSDGGTMRYDSVAGGAGPQGATFDFTFAAPTDLIGHMKLRVFVSAEQGDDMDLFVGIQKVDASGALVPFTFYAQFEDGPVALGWLRVSHRELDAARSTEYQPGARARARAQTLRRRSSACRYRNLAVGHGVRGRRAAAARHSRVRHLSHVIHAGGEWESYLLVPVVPPR